MNTSAKAYRAAATNLPPFAGAVARSYHPQDDLRRCGYCGAWKFVAAVCAICERAL